MIRFKFNPEKALSAIAYCLRKLGPTDKAKLTKLLYIADRSCFLKYGYPITGDRQCAMQLGPVPSACLDLLNGNAAAERVFECIHTVDDRVELKQEPEPSALVQAENEVLDSVIQEHGSKPTWDLVEETHTFPEYKEVYVEGTSKTIRYESILKYYGTEDQFRHGRPVISRQMASKMLCPFPSSDVDL